MELIIIANILGLVDNVIYTISTNCTSKKNMMKLQIISCIFGMISLFLLGGYIGVAMGITCLLRNILISYDEFDKKMCIVIIFTQIALFLLINTEGILGIFAMSATVIYTLMLYNSDDKKHICLTIAVNTALWSVYHFSILAIVAGIFNIVGLVLSLHNLYKLYKIKEGEQ